MKGRIAGEREQIITLAHQIEAMARQKSLKPLSIYLAQKKRARPSDGRAVIELLKRKGVKVEPITKPGREEEE